MCRCGSRLCRDLAWPVCDSFNRNTWTLFFRVQQLDAVVYSKNTCIDLKSLRAKISWHEFSPCVLCDNQKYPSILNPYCFSGCAETHHWLINLCDPPPPKNASSVNKVCKVSLISNENEKKKWMLLRQTTPFWIWHSQASGNMFSLQKQRGGSTWKTRSDQSCSFPSRLRLISIWTRQNAI